VRQVVVVMVVVVVMMMHESCGSKNTHNKPP